MHRPLLSQWQCPKKLTSQHQRLIAAQKSQSQMSAIETAILEDEDVRCHNFSVGNPRLQEFYSPGYPGKYPPKSDCILALKGSHAFCLLQDTCSTLVLFFFYCKICLSCFYFWDWVDQQPRWVTSFALISVTSSSLSRMKIAITIFWKCATERTAIRPS